MNKYEAAKQEVREWAEKIKDMGFRVFIAEKGTYGVISDAEGSRALSFQFDGPWSSLSGNYGPPAKESGTGWKMDLMPWQLNSAADVRGALYAMPPAFAGRGWKNMTTLDQHLKTYESSRYVEVM